MVSVAFITMKGGTRGIVFFLADSVIMLVSFELELPSLAR